MSDCRQNLLVWPDLVRSTLTIRGADRIQFLHNLCTNDIRDRAPGATVEAFFASVQGRILGHGLISLPSDHSAIVLPPGQAASLQKHLEKYVIREDVEVVDTSERWCYALVCGDGAADWLTTRLLPTLTQGLGSHASNPAETDTCMILDCPYVPRTGVILKYPTDLRSSMLAIDFDQLTARVMPAEAFERLRIRAGWPEYGTDIDERNLPQEVGRDPQAIHFRKGCYLGQETVARIDALGHVNQTLCGIVLDPPATICPATEIRAGERCVGRCTSAYTDRASGRTYALAYLRRDFRDSEASDYFSRQSGRVVSLPFPDDA